MSTLLLLTRRWRGGPKGGSGIWPPGQLPKMGALSARKRATAAWRCHRAESRDGMAACPECREKDPVQH